MKIKDNFAAKILCTNFLKLISKVLQKFMEIHTMKKLCTNFKFLYESQIVFKNVCAYLFLLYSKWREKHRKKSRHQLVLFLLFFVCVLVWGSLATFSTGRHILRFAPAWRGAGASVFAFNAILVKIIHELLKKYPP